MTKKRSVTFWALFWYGANKRICSEHFTRKAAVAAARACERRGGLPHWIVQVKTVCQLNRGRR